MLNSFFYLLIIAFKLLKLESAYFYDLFGIA